VYASDELHERYTVESGESISNAPPPPKEAWMWLFFFHFPLGEVMRSE
jgi:hypothetical protein